MGSLERSKKKVQLWQKAIVHFALCFIMGFFSGFAPTSKSSIFLSSSRQNIISSNKSYNFSPQPIENTLDSAMTPQSSNNNVNRSNNSAETPVITPAKLLENYPVDDQNQNQDQEEKEKNLLLVPRRLIIIVTPTSSSSSDKYYNEVLLRRLANTIKLVSPPLLWIVVEGAIENNKVSEILRKTGIMYRHLVSKENFTEAEAEYDHQRNIALRHIEQHRLSGIVHFAGLSNVYDLAFFNELREIEVFGTWPMAILTANRNKVIIEGPVCDSSQVIGWHLKKMNNETEEKPPNPIHISSFAFNSSILWDPERWGRPSSIPHTSQNSIKFVKEVALEDETKLKGIPQEDCSKIMLWQLNLPFQQRR